MNDKEKVLKEAMIPELAHLCGDQKGKLDSLAIEVLARHTHYHNGLEPEDIESVKGLLEEVYYRGYLDGQKAQ